MKIAISILVCFAVIAFSKGFSLNDVGETLSKVSSKIEKEFEEIINEGMQGDEPATDESSAPNCQKCTTEVNELRKNISQLTGALIALREEFEHIVKHVAFHERALKHIAHSYHGHSTLLVHSTTVHQHGEGHVHSHGDSHTHHHDHLHDSNHSIIAGSHGQDLHNLTLLEGQHLHHDEHHHEDHHEDHGHDHQNSTDVHSDQHEDEHHHSYHSEHGNLGANHVRHHDEHHHHHEHSHEGHGHEETESHDHQNEHDSHHDHHDHHHHHANHEHSPSQPEIPENPDTKLNEALNDQEASVSNSHTFKSSKHRAWFRKDRKGKESKEFENEYKNWFFDMISPGHGHKHKKSSPNSRVAKTLNENKINEMEQSLHDEDLLFATCEVRPNRHIALLLQQEVTGRINLWQKKSGNGPVYIHAKLRGFKIHHHLEKRETVIAPVEQDVESSSEHSHLHGFHVHESANMTRDCQSVGSHYNPTNQNHGGPIDETRHVGDLDNIRCDANGETDTEFVFPKVSLIGEHSILGRSLVIHSQPDDYGRNRDSPGSSTTGSSGVRIACCVIEVNQLPKSEDSRSTIHPISVPSSK